MKYLLFTLLLGSIFISCDDDDKDSCNTENITYTNTVAAIFNSSCNNAGCHIDGNDLVSGFSLEGYELSKLAATLMRMEGSLNHDTGFSPMPKDQDMLDQCDIDKVTAWIAAGSPE